MMAFLIAIRDVFLAVALAWVGVTLESRTEQTQQPCTGQTCSDGER